MHGAAFDRFDTRSAHTHNSQLVTDIISLPIGRDIITLLSVTTLYTLDTPISSCSLIRTCFSSCCSHALTVHINSLGSCTYPASFAISITLSTCPIFSLCNASIFVNFVYFASINAPMGELFCTAMVAFESSAALLLQLTLLFGKLVWWRVLQD